MLKTGILIACLNVMRLSLLGEEPATQFVEHITSLTNDLGPSPVTVKTNGRITTRERFRPPVEIVIEAKTDSTNPRLAYAADELIFNWELDRGQLRVGGGPGNGKHKLGAGLIPINQYVTVQWIVTSEKQSVSVDGKLKLEHSGDYSQIDKPISVFPSHGSEITVKSIKVRSLSAENAAANTVAGKVIPVIPPNVASTKNSLPITSPTQGIVLDAHWNTPLQGGSATIRDLGALLSPVAKAAKDLQPHPTLSIYQDVTYLMHLQGAKTALGFAGRAASKNKVACPGFPTGSLFYYGFSGTFEGHYNQLYIVTDKADQVVSIQLVAEHPNKDMSLNVGNDQNNWHTYNFVNTRIKSLNTLNIGHSVSYQRENNSWATYEAKNDRSRPMTPPNLIRIDSVLSDPHFKDARSGHTTKPLESVRWYLPAPLAGLILESVNKATPNAQ